MTMTTTILKWIMLTVLCQRWQHSPRSRWKQHHW